MQSITDVNILVKDDQAVMEYTVPKTELLANWACAAKLAELEGLPGVAARLKADILAFERMLDGDRIVVRG